MAFRTCSGILGGSLSAQAEIRKQKNKEISEFDAGSPDFGGRWPRGEALGKKIPRDPDALKEEPDVFPSTV